MSCAKQEHTLCSTSSTKNPRGSHGRQLARRMGWAAHAYHKEEGAAPHPGAHKHSLQNDGRPDWHFGVQVGTWNLDGGKGEKFVKNSERG